MARNHFAACIVAALALGACGKHDTAAADAAANKKVAAIRAHHDSVQKAHARAAADSVTRALYTLCSDSVTVAFAKAPGHKKAKGPSPELVAGACGQGVTTTLAASTAKPDTVRATAPSALTPAQIQLARADSIRRAHDAARAESDRAAAEQAHADSLRVAMADSVRGDSTAKARETEVQRESFAYGGGPRDPFSSLINVKTEGPELVDLQLVGIYQDLHNNANSVAVLREKTSTKQHKLRVGDELGRLRVSQIRARDVVFQIEDFGFERQETLSLRKQEDVTP